MIVPLYGKMILALSHEQIGFVSSSLSLACIVVVFSTGKLERSFSRKSLFISGFLMCALAAFFSLASNFYAFLGMAIVYGIGLGLVRPSQTSLMADLTSYEERGLKLSVFFAIGDLGMIVGPITTSFLMNLVDMRLPFYVIALECGVFSLLAFRFIRIEKENMAS